MGPNRSFGLWRLRHNTARPDIVGTYQPQPVDPLLVGEVCGVLGIAVHAALPTATSNDEAMQATYLRLQRSL
jgi:hypothetical protein